jgi:hypothetical protein
MSDEDYISVRLFELAWSFLRPANCVCTCSWFRHLCSRHFSRHLCSFVSLVGAAVHTLRVGVVFVVVEPMPAAQAPTPAGGATAAPDAMIPFPMSPSDLSALDVSRKVTRHTGAQATAMQVRVLLFTVC